MNYTGELKDGQPHGKGKMFWKDGSFYDGEWEKGVIDGFGTKKTPGLYYEGFFKDGHKYGKGKNIFGDGEVHEGDYENGLLNGHGNITYANDDEFNRNNYIGEVKDGHPHGKGELVWKSGKSYDGEWQKGVINGFGIERFPNGSYYEGNFQNSNWFGKGKNILSNGEIHEGEFRYKDVHGKGNITYAKDDEQNSYKSVSKWLELLECTEYQ